MYKILFKYNNGLSVYSCSKNGEDVFEDKESAIFSAKKLMKHNDIKGCKVWITNPNGLKERVYLRKQLVKK